MAEGSTPLSERTELARKLLRPIIVLIALHSFLVGLMLTFAPEWSSRFAGWVVVGPDFFPRQGGVFHLILAVAYVYEHFRHDGVFLLVLAKMTAMIFLVSSSITGEVPWAIPFSGVTDGMMGFVVLILYRHLATNNRRA